MASPQEQPITPNPSALRISAFIVCCNEERKIRRCLESIAWCDEIVVVDSGSTDQTLSICREYTDRIFQRPWPGFVEQKRYALEQCRSEWALNIDADEEVSPELRTDIEGILANDDPSNVNAFNGYELSRVVFFLGRWWRKGGWYPEFRLRLCRRTRTDWGGEDPHERALVEGAIGRLKGELRHYTYANLADQVRSLNSLSTAAAATLHRHGRRSSLLVILSRPIGRFFKFYVLKRGFREGVAGVLVAIFESAYVFLKYAKLWELEHIEHRDKEQ